MTKWITRNKTPDAGGFILELSLGDEQNQAQVRLLKSGRVVAWGSASQSADAGFIEHETDKYDLHEEEIAWIKGILIREFA